MRRYGYALAFILVLLLACVGGFLGGRFLLARLQQDLMPPQAGWTPPAPATLGQAGAQTPAATTPGAASTLPAQPAATALVAPTPTSMPPASVASPSPTPTVPAASTDEAVTPSPTIPESPTPARAYLYALARPVRYSTGDCPGIYVLGQVTDRTGAPVPDVRLYLVDQYGNAATAVSKSGATDAGRYDFPIGGPARRFFLTVIDAGGLQLSPQVEIGFGLAPEPQATCFWVDWRRR